MRLEQPRIDPKGDLRARLEYLEQYIYRLYGELQAALNALEKAQKEGGKDNA